MSRVIKRLCLWSGPRNISTALMYSFAQRQDTLVFDEPLYAHYLSQTHAKSYHPGAQDILSTMENDGQKVVAMMMADHPKPVVFFKNMTHHVLNLDKTFMKQVVNVILTREPEEMLASFSKVIQQPTMADVGYEAHTRLLAYFQEQQITPIVLDAKLVLQNPEKVLKKLCDLAGIPFDKRMLSWKAGKRPEDGIWAPYWYTKVHQSTGFEPYKPKQTRLPEALQPLLKECQQHYQLLKGLAIK